MHPRGPSTALLLVVIVLIAGFLTGCGGGDQSGSGGSQQGGAAKQKEANKQKEAKEKKGNAPEKKIALGTVRFVNTETKRFTVRPSTEQQGKKPIVFNLVERAKITLNGKEAEIGDMKKGQQAQVQYVVKNDHNRARDVKLFEGGSSAGDQGGEKTG